MTYESDLTENRREQIDRRKFLANSAWAAVGLFASNKANELKNAMRIRHEEDLRGQELTKHIEQLTEQMKPRVDNRIGKEMDDRRRRERELYEMEHPGSVPLGTGLDVTEFAKLMYGEMRGHFDHDEYRNWISSTPLTRYRRSGSTMNSIIFDQKKVTNPRTRKSRVEHQFSCFNEWDINYPYVVDPLHDVVNHPEDGVAWDTLYRFAQESVGSRPKHDVTHYWVDNVKEPYWAKGETPVKVMSFKEGTTRFYDLGPYRPRGAFVDI